MPSAPVIGSGVNGTNGAGNVTLDLSALTLLEGDAVVVGGGFDGSSHPGSTPGVVTAGFDELVTPHIDSDSGDPCGGIWYQRLGASPSLTSIVCQGTGSGIAGCNYGWYVIRGLDPATLLDALPAKVLGALAPANPGAVETQTDNALVLVFAVQTLSNVAASAAPSGYSNFITRSSGNTWDSAIAGALKEVATAGTIEDPGPWSWTDDNQNQVVWTVALRVAGNALKPLAPDLSVTAGAGWVRWNTGDFRPHPDNPTDVHTASKYQLASDPAFALLVVDEELGAPFLTEYQAPGIPPGTYYARAAHVGS